MAATVALSVDISVDKDAIHPDPEKVSDFLSYMRFIESDPADLRDGLSKRFTKQNKAPPSDLIEKVLADPGDFDAKLELLNKYFDKPKTNMDMGERIIAIFQSEFATSPLFVCFYLEINADNVKELVKIAFQNKTNKNESFKSQLLAAMGVPLNLQTRVRPDSFANFIMKDLQNSEFLDPYHLVDEFYDWVKFGSSNSKFYSPYFALCQRSGSGKTHLLYETGKTKTFMCYVLLDNRAASPTPEFIVKKLKAIHYPHSSGNESPEHQQKAIMFFAAVMKYLLDFVNRCEHTGAHSHECFEKFFSHFTGARSTSGWKRINEYWESFEKNEFVDMDGETGLNLKEESLTKQLADALRGKMVSSIVVSFDEARELLHSGNDIVNSFQILRDVLSSEWESTETLLSMIVTDTNSTITNFTPSISAFKPHTTRMIRTGTDLCPPFYFFNSQDIKASDYLSKAFEYVESQSEQRFAQFFKWRDDNIELFATLGSPLWTQRLQFKSKNESGKKDLGNLLEFADGKLKSACGITQEAQIAALSSRCSIKILPNTALARNLVANHMGMLCYLSDDRTLAFIDYPSDPVLAAATPLILSQPQTGKDMSCLECLNDLARRSVIDLGQSGESVLQIILQAAVDKVFLDRTPKPSAQYLMPIAVPDFLTVLLGKSKFMKLRRQLGKKDAIFKGRIFFNHAIQAKENLTPRDFVISIIRGGLIVGSHNQPGWDIAVPVVLPNGDPAGLYFNSKQYQKMLCDYQKKRWFKNSLSAGLVCSENRTNQLAELKLNRSKKKAELKSAKDDQLIAALTEEISHLQTAIKEFDFSTKSLHILVNFCQGAMKDKAQFEINNQNRSIVIQGDCIGSVFQNVWSAESRISPARQIEALNKILKAGSSGYYGLEKSEDRIRKAFNRSFPASSPFSEELLKTKASYPSPPSSKRQRTAGDAQQS